MEHEGPPLEALTRRLAECPAEFPAEPVIGGKGTVHVAAVVSDLVCDLGGRRCGGTGGPVHVGEPPHGPQPAAHGPGGLLAAA